jgi:hypothetical protein
MTLGSITTLSIAIKYAMPSITTSGVSLCVIYADCRIFEIVMLSGVMANVIMLSVALPKIPSPCLKKKRVP